MLLTLRFMLLDIILLQHKGIVSYGYLVSISVYWGDIKAPYSILYIPICASHSFLDDSLFLEDC